MKNPITTLFAVILALHIDPLVKAVQVLTTPENMDHSKDPTSEYSREINDIGTFTQPDKILGNEKYRPKIPRDMDLVLDKDVFVAHSNLPEHSEMGSTILP